MLIIVRFKSKTSRDGHVSRCGDEFRESFPCGPFFDRENIARQLFANKLIVRFVAIEGVNNIVSVAARLWDGVIGCETGRIRVAYDIQPVSPPTLAVDVRGEQPCDDAMRGLI